jgi:methylated-DNA-[protein]-cysteine S-methyltransferase
MTELKDQRDLWNRLYKEILPGFAKQKDSVQETWPVHLDHCFARIILDNTIGENGPWTDYLKAPAVKYMSVEQLKAANLLAQMICNGQADLVALDERSLQLRGKKSKVATKRKSDGVDGDPRQQKISKNAKCEGAIERAKGVTTISSYFLPSPSFGAEEKATKETDKTDNSPVDTSRSKSDPDMAHQLTRIQNSDITSFRKQMLTLLCQIPRGRYSTYQAMADHVSKTSHKSCARAVGNAMKNNPFAPEVPCHRVLASDGTLGGFKGSWGEEGKYASLKHQLLAEEGVKFDSRGKVKGPPFREFHG